LGKETICNQEKKATWLLPWFNMSEKGQEIRHVDEAGDNFLHAWKDEKWGKEKLTLSAYDMATEEKEMSMWKAIISSKKAILWSLAVSTCVIMEGCK
jgi:hypothetical protein